MFFFVIARLVQAFIAGLNGPPVCARPYENEPVTSRFWIMYAR